MSVRRNIRPPSGDSAERASARETLWRLAALAFSHPTPEFHAALTEGRFFEGFNAVHAALTGRGWMEPAGSGDFAALESGYIEAFLHGRGGKPIAPLLAGDYETLLAGHSRPVFMLNIAAFYRHFGLKAAADDEGRADEPDHLAGMLEFMAVLSHLEANAIERSADPDGFRRAQRDFLRRHLVGFLSAIADRLRNASVVQLDPTLRQLVEDLPHLAEDQANEAEARVGPYHDRDAASRPVLPGLQDRMQNQATPPRVVDQNLWG